MEKKRIGNEEELILAPENNETEELVEIEAPEIMREDTQEPEKEIKKSVCVKEIVELRGENKKVFKMSDGTEQAVFFASPIHAFDDETHTFKEESDTICEDEEARHLVCKKNRFLAKFSQEEENDEIFSIENGMHRVVVSSYKTKKNRNKGVKPTMNKKKINDIKNLNVLTYENVEAGADYEYSVEGDGVKENIIVKTKANVYRYPFIIHCENVTPKLNEKEKRIAFLSNETGEEVFFIPAPFMTDANGTTSTGVCYELRTHTSGDTVLTVTADGEWINAESRAFPVVIDPQIKLSGTAATTTYAWIDGAMNVNSTCNVGITKDACCNKIINRMYMKFNIPSLPNNPRIKKAELVLTQSSGTIENSVAPKIGLYQVTSSIYSGTCTPSQKTNFIDYAKMQSGSDVTYRFDITTLMDQAIKGDISIKSLVLKMLEETTTTTDIISIYGYNGSVTYAPQIIVTYESSYAVNTSYRTHSHDIARFGKASIDLQCGNLMFESEDFAWTGNRMPVTIKHLYNSALSDYKYSENSDIKLNVADFSGMNIGYGFKLNVMQSIVETSFYHDGAYYEGYVFVGENGEETYLKPIDEANADGEHLLFEAVDGSDMHYDKPSLTLTQGDSTYLFDTNGRLLKITDAHNNNMCINYTDGRISSVVDGAERSFDFVYNDSSYLIAIQAPDSSVINFSYVGAQLSEISYPDGRKVHISYNSLKPASVELCDKNGNGVYKVAYEFNGDKLTSVTEYGAENGSYVIGNKSTYSYSIASGKTSITTTEQADGEEVSNDIVTTYTFDDDGNVISEYTYSKDTGNVASSSEGSGINPHSNDKGVTSNINNLLLYHDFTSLSYWYAMSNNSSFSYKTSENEAIAKFGKTYLEMTSNDETTIANGIYQTTTMSLPTGQYTFSAYAQVAEAFTGNENPGVYIRVVDLNGNILGMSEHLAEKDSQYVRLIVPFEITSAAKVKVQILVNGKGTIYVDAAQLENNPYANAYNILESGNFESTVSRWSHSAGTGYSTANKFNMRRSLYITGNISTLRYASQTITPKSNRGAKETFTLSGWAKGNGLPANTRTGLSTPVFRLRAVVKYYDTYYEDYTSETYTADFLPCTDDWQFASIQFSKCKYRTIKCIYVYCDYGYNTGTAYFDDIQLIRDSIELDLQASEFVSESTSDANDNTETLSVDDVSAPVFNEAGDEYGNTLTETTFTDGELGTIYRSFRFNDDENCYVGNEAGNNLVAETDSRGNTTQYTVECETSRNEEIIDRCGNKTAYEYDEAGRTTKVTSKDSSDNELATVSYSYNSFDNVSEIVRGDGMKYVLAYNSFNNLESINIDGKTDGNLITYSYKNGNGRLKQMTYANGHTMKAAYNSVGQMVAETWFDINGVETARYKYVYDGDGNIVRSIDILSEKEYNYEYEEGRIVRATEADITISNEIVTSKTITNTIKYYYDSEGKMTKKIITPTIGTTQSIYYENNDDNTVVKFDVPDNENINNKQTITSHSKTDSFGRKVFDELQIGRGFVSRQFSYMPGAITEAHKENRKIKSTATTQLVSHIALSDGRTISYKYDDEERIIEVTDTIDGTVSYTYDALGQLETETKDGVTTKFEYDNYGNITAKGVVDEAGEIAEATKISYVYGNDTWKDLLTSYNGQSITYDAQGNPTSYLGHTLTWEKGRQLKKFVKSDGTVIDYTYNANGIRTSKKVNGVKHEYTLDGTKILRETWNGNTLVHLYDNEGGVCGILYNNVPYYFIKNLQGDVIAIVNKDAQTVARYSYDAWGAVTNAVTYTELTDGVDIATINPFRYRGYYYDEEIGLYYLQSRYYNPSTGRFINGDTLLSCDIDKRSLATNAFVYSTNNPINESDYAGNIPWKKIGEVLLGALMGGASQYISDVCQNLSECVLKNYKITNNIWKFRSGIGSYAISVVSGALDAALNIGIWETIGLTIVTTVVKHLVDWLTGKDFSIVALIEEIVWKIFLALVMKSLTKKFSPKQGKKMNQYIRQKFKVKGTVAYRQYFEKILKSFSKKMTFLSTLVDTIKSSCQLFLDFLKQAIFDCIIKGLNEKYA